MNLKMKINSTLFTAIFAVIITIGFTSCKQTTQDNQNKTIVQSETVNITEQEVLDAQKAWGEGIVKIGKVYLEEGDYKSAALNHINEFYTFNKL